MEARRIRVLIVEDHLVVRTGLRLIIESQSDMDVVGEARDGMEAAGMVEELSPNVVVMDISLPGLSGLEAARRIKSARPDVRILFLTMHDNEEYFFQAIQSGADGYVTKSAPEWEVLTGIRSVHQGQCYLNPKVAKYLVNDYLDRIKSGEEKVPYDGLTDREREILHLVALGNSNREIAQILMISEHTVHNHRARLMEKLGVHNRLELLKHAIRRGIISPDV